LPAEHESATFLVLETLNVWTTPCLVEDGFRFDTAAAQSEYQWNGIGCWLENEKMFMLRTSPRFFIMVLPGVMMLLFKTSCCSEKKRWNI